MTKDCKVGYKSPPEESKWKKGQSGNPSGRKKSSDHYDDVVDVLGEAVPVRSGARTTWMPAVGLMFRKMCLAAIRGENKALKEAVLRSLVHQALANEKQATRPDWEGGEDPRLTLLRKSGHDVEPADLVETKETRDRQKQIEKQVDKIMRQRKRARERAANG